MYWQDKVVFLTGASSGIGEALALAMAERGATLGLAARRRELLDDLADRCRRFVAKVRIFPLDVFDEIALAEAAD